MKFSFSLSQMYKKYFLLSIVILLIVPFVLLYYLLVAPTKNSLSVLKNQVAELENTLAKIKEDKKLAEENARKLEKISQLALNKAEEALPSQPKVENLLQIFEDKAREYGFVLKNLTINEIPKEVGQKDLLLPRNVFALRLQANFAGGDYNALKHLINGLENNARLFDIESINFSAGKGEYVIVLRTYWLAETKPQNLRFDEEFFLSKQFQNLASSERTLEFKTGNPNLFAPQK